MIDNFLKKIFNFFLILNLLNIHSRAWIKVMKLINQDKNGNNW